MQHKHKSNPPLLQSSSSSRVDLNLVDRARALWAMVQAVAKFLVHMQLIVAAAEDDAEKLDRRKRAAELKAARAKAAETRSKVFRHAPLRDPGGLRCLWCNRRAVNEMGLNRFKCVQAPGHLLWRSGGLVMGKKHPRPKRKLRRQTRCVCKTETAPLLRPARAPHK